MFDKVLKEIELGIIDLRFNKKSDIGAKSDIDIAVIRLIEEASIKLATARELNIISSSYVKKEVKKEVIEEVKVKKETFKKTVEIEENEKYDEHWQSRGQLCRTQTLYRTRKRKRRMYIGTSKIPIEQVNKFFELLACFKGKQAKSKCFHLEEISWASDSLSRFIGTEIDSKEMRDRWYKVMQGDKTNKGKRILNIFNSMPDSLVITALRSIPLIKHYQSRSLMCFAKKENIVKSGSGCGEYEVVEGFSMEYLNETLLNLPSSPPIAASTPATPIEFVSQKGVTWDKACDKWLARVFYRGKSNYFGHYDDREDAIKAVLKGREKLSIEHLAKRNAKA